MYYLGSSLSSNLVSLRRQGKFHIVTIRITAMAVPGIPEIAYITKNSEFRVGYICLNTYWFLKE